MPSGSWQRLIAEMSQPSWQRSWSSPLVITAVAVALTAWVYGSAALVDAHLLQVSDDKANLSYVRRVGLSHPLKANTDHLMPVGWGIYWACWKLFGEAWTPYAILLLAAHAALSALIGLAVVRLSGSVLAGLVVTPLFTLSAVFVSGPLLGFLSFLSYTVMIAHVLIVMLLQQGARLWWIGLVSGVSLFVLGPGTFTLVVLPFYAAALRVARGTWRDALDVRTLRLTLVLAVLYVAVLGFGVLAHANPLPGTAVIGEPSTLPRLTRSLNLLRYSVVGTVLPVAASDTVSRLVVLSGFPTMPKLVDATDAGLAAILGLVGLFTLPLLSRRRDPRLPEHAVIGIALLGLAAAMTLLVTLGRGGIAMWQMRYAGYSTVFAALALGQATGILLALGRRRLGLLVAVLLMLLMLWAAAEEVKYLRVRIAELSALRVELGRQAEAVGRIPR